eukprot:TRINITY_DN201_c5_g1_i1.p1 TRINITY_DN201_c5_g1~~TRINITY_DN201_c5_g1_i1.p1  ORF type:complete len:490 (-),score=180.18 TRINITY_DN201_c5_g1_i1:156-1625(-)
MDDTIYLRTIETWQNDKTIAEIKTLNTSTLSNQSEIKFPFNEELNNKLTFWLGDITKLGVDIIVVNSNETFNDLVKNAENIAQLGGDALAKELLKLEPCKTGEARLVKAFNIPAKYLILTVGPRYNPKYKTAAENALHCCYRTSLQLLKEEKLSTIAFTVINTRKRGYPPEDATHIVLRTIRRFLEHFGANVNRVVLTAQLEEDILAYKKLLPAYFPRSTEEHIATLNLLPENLGNEFGETVFEERKIRISNLVFSDDLSQSYLKKDYDVIPESPIVLTSPSDLRQYATISRNPDSGVIVNSDETPENNDEETKAIYRTLLKRAKKEDLSDMQELNFIFSSGFDDLGRAIIVVVGMNLPFNANTNQLERILMHVILTMDPIVNREYVIVYLHENMQDSQQPEFAWLKKVYNIWSHKYSRNLRGLFIVSPTWWLKLFFTVLSPLITSLFLERMTYVENLNKLFEYVPRRCIKLPSFFQNQLDKDDETNNL